MEPDAASYQLILPAKATGILVFASPHSGRLYPDDMRPAQTLGPASLRSAEDALMDQLAQTGPQRGAPLICGLIGRSYLDLNRAEHELDPRLIDDVPDRPVSPRTTAGYGVLARLSGDGRPLYDRRLDHAEAEARLARVHRPYHQVLAQLMLDARARHGRAVLVDWHSMPALSGPQAADICLGDRHGAACAPALIRRLAALFEAEGLRVALNRPYAGGYATTTWGRPSEGLHAVQIELSRALYLDGARPQRGQGWDRTAAMTGRVIAALCAEAEDLIPG